MNRLTYKKICHRDQDHDVDQTQESANFKIILGSILTGPHVGCIHLMGRQHERIGNTDADDNGRHTEIDSDLVGI